MPKIGISIRIDVTKIDKARLYKGEKGTYLDLVTFVDTTEEDQYGNHGFIKQSLDEDERKAKVEMPILGNCKIFYNLARTADNPPQETAAPTQAPAQQAPAPVDPDLEDIPFAPCL